MLELSDDFSLLLLNLVSFVHLNGAPTFVQRKKPSVLYFGKFGLVFHTLKNLFVVWGAR